MKRFMCKLFGHKWEYKCGYVWFSWGVYTLVVGKNPRNETPRFCTRCKVEVY